MTENPVILDRALISLKLRSVLATALLLAPSSRTLVRDANLSDRLRQSAKHNLVTIPVQLNGGAAVPFALDSGASSTIVNEKLASKLRLQQAKTVVGHGAGIGPCILREMLQVKVRAGGGNVESSVFAASLEPLESFMGLPMNGVVGGTLFLTHVVSIDYRARTAYISKTTNFVSRPNDIRILVTPSGSLCCVAHAEIQLHGMHWPARLLIDTGALPFEVVLTREFAAQRNITVESRTEIVEVPGLCGMSKLAKSAAIAHIQGLPAIPAVIFVSTDNRGSLSSADFDGVIGSELLRRFGTVIFDARNHQVVLRLEGHSDHF